MYWINSNDWVGIKQDLTSSQLNLHTSHLLIRWSVYSFTKVEDYHQQFSRAGPGLISSKTEHMYTLEKTNEIVTFSVDQTVR